jgi:hypothetical protein
MIFSNTPVFIPETSLFLYTFVVFSVFFNFSGRDGDQTRDLLYWFYIYFHSTAEPQRLPPTVVFTVTPRHSAQ